MKTIEFEKFEAWLFAQPDEKVFDYSDTTNCMICQFLKTQTRLGVTVGGETYSLYPSGMAYCGERDNRPLPAWLDKFVSPSHCYNWLSKDTATFKQAKQRFAKMFPPTPESNDTRSNLTALATCQ